MSTSHPVNKKYFKFISLGSVVLLLFFIGILFLFGMIAHEVLGEKEENLDNLVFSFLSANVINNRLTGIMKIITYFGSAVFLEIAYGILVVISLVLKKWSKAVEISLIGIGGYVINYIMKLSFHRVRPPDPLIAPLKNFSFPSGHATAAFIFYGLLIYLAWKTKLSTFYKNAISIPLFLLALLIGFSRVYLRLHYTSDVIAGFCIGLAWLILSFILFEKFQGHPKAL